MSNYYRFRLNSLFKPLNGIQTLFTPKNRLMFIYVYSDDQHKPLKNVSPKMIRVINLEMKSKNIREATIMEAYNENIYLFRKHFVIYEYNGCSKEVSDLKGMYKHTYQT